MVVNGGQSENVASVGCNRNCGAADSWIAAKVIAAKGRARIFHYRCRGLKADTSSTGHAEVAGGPLLAEAQLEAYAPHVHVGLNCDLESVWQNLAEIQERDGYRKEGWPCFAGTLPSR